jgi:hypothetical protein
MHDKACINFPQHYLPKLGYRWKGFRKVRNQVCKRINKRVKELDLGNIQAYREYLENHGGKIRPLKKKKTNIGSRMNSARMFSSWNRISVPNCRRVHSISSFAATGCLPISWKTSRGINLLELSKSAMSENG